MIELDDDQLQKLYTWIDEIPLSRPKRNIARDFSDGVLVAEVVNHYFPRIIDVHNYVSANSTQQKLTNWSTLNNKVMGKLSCKVPRNDIEDIVQCKPGAIERTLHVLQGKIVKHKGRRSVSEITSSIPPDGGAPGTLGRHFAPAIGVTAGDHEQGTAGSNCDVSCYTRGTLGGGAVGAVTVDTELLVEKEQTIMELRETVEILELKVKKLEQLVRLKDSKIQSMAAKLQQLQ